MVHAWLLVDPPCCAVVLPFAGTTLAPPGVVLLPRAKSVDVLFVKTMLFGRSGVIYCYYFTTSASASCGHYVTGRDGSGVSYVSA